MQLHGVPSPLVIDLRASPSVRLRLCSAEALQRSGMFSPSLLIPASRFISCSEGVSSAASKWRLEERHTKFHEGEKPSSSFATRIVYNKNTKSKVCFGDDRIMKQLLKKWVGKWDKTGLICLQDEAANLCRGWTELRFWFTKHTEQVGWLLLHYRTRCFNKESCCAPVCVCLCVWHPVCLLALGGRSC